MQKHELTQYADYLLKIAIGKCDNLNDAQDLTQDTLLAALAALEKGKEIIEPMKWLSTVLNRKYYDMLRSKYRRPTVCIDMVGEIPVEDVYDVDPDEAENVRRSLAMLTKMYREVMVRFYMKSQSVKQIAEELGIPENTVKTRLSVGRKHVRKEFEMENYTKQSYEPETLYLGNCGQCGANMEPFSLIRGDKIAENILIIAYEKPLTISEIAGAIGISTAYIEPIIDKLVSGELMKKSGDKVYTDFIIYSQKDREENLDKVLSLAEKFFAENWYILDEGLGELRQEEFYKQSRAFAKKKLEAYFVVKTMSCANVEMRDTYCGGTEPFDNYPDRPNNGKWYAMGNKVSPEELSHSMDVTKYDISGESSNQIMDFCGLDEIEIREYDCCLGKTHSAYDNDKIMEFRTDETETMKMLYLIYSGEYDKLNLINIHCYDNVDAYIGMNYLSKNEAGEVVVEVPVLKDNEYDRLTKLFLKYKEMVVNSFVKEFKVLFDKPVVTPKHIKSIPDWLKLLWCSAQFPMAVINKAVEEKKFLADSCLPVPAILLVTKEKKK